EHSLEAIAYFLRHARPDLEIVPILVPAASFPRLQGMAAHLGAALAAAMKRRGLELGRDVAIVISTDATHYGADFSYTPSGAGGAAASEMPPAAARALGRDTLEGPVAAERAQRFSAAVVNPANPDEYRKTWCGRFSVPFGLLLLDETARRLGLPAPRG